MAGLIVAIASASMWFFADAALKPDQAMIAVAWMRRAASRFPRRVLLLDRVRRDSTRMRAIAQQRDQFLGARARVSPCRLRR